jgi:hypothetical protein
MQRARWQGGLGHAQSFRSARQAAWSGALRLSGPTFAHDEINSETQYADLRHEPDPAHHAERARLGLLGRFASEPCLIEVYSQAPGAVEFRACLAKHLASWQQRSRKARAEAKRHEPVPPELSDSAEPFLWILSAGAPTSLVTKLRLEPAPSWPPGVYLVGADVLRVGIVIASELPCDLSTLLVRLMAAGPLLAQAAKEVADLPPTAHERAVAEPALLQLHHALGQSPSPDPDEQEFIMVMIKTWEEGKAEARKEGREEGRAEALGKSVLTVLRVRGIVVPEAARTRILAQGDLRLLESWFEKAIVATALADVIDDLG